MLNVLSSAGASILAVGYTLIALYLLYSLWKGEKAGANRRKATGLEWQTESPPPPDNFAVTPIVTEGANRARNGRSKLPELAAHRRSARARTHPALQHHFQTLDQQHEAATLGMWVFLVTEVMFFGGLPHGVPDLSNLVLEAWAEGSEELSIALGVSTRWSSLPAVSRWLSALRSAQTGTPRATVKWLLITIALGLTFLVVVL